MSDDLEVNGRLGDLIVAAYDEAAQHSSDPAEIKRLATKTITHILERVRRPVPSNSPEPAGRLRLLSPAGRQAVVSGLKLVPRDGPRIRLRPPGVLRLVRAPTPPLRLCGEPAALEREADGEEPASGAHEPE